MKKCGGLAAILFAFSLLTGCSDSAGAEYILAQENTDLSEQLEEKLDEETLVAEKALNQEEFEKKWNAFNLISERPEVDWENKAVLFVGTEESGTCPKVMEGREFNAEENTILFDFKDYEGACTADAHPLTFVLELERNVIEEMQQVQVDNTTIAIR